MPNDNRASQLIAVARAAFEAEAALWKREHDPHQNIEEFRKHGSKFNVWRSGGGERTVYVDYDEAVKLTNEAAWKAAEQAVADALA